MRTIDLRAMSAGLALLAAVSALAAQESKLLTGVEVQQLVAGRGTPDHAQLRDHFAALVGVYLADARRLKNMAQAMLTNSNRPLAVSLARHSVRLAELAAASAETVRELSAHHGRLADRRPSQPLVPKSGASSQAGSAASVLTDTRLQELAANARTPADHRSLAGHFTALAETYTNAAKEETELARAYRIQGRRTGSDYPAILCDRMVSLLREAAAEALAEATEHGQLAKGG